MRKIISKTVAIPALTTIGGGQTIDLNLDDSIKRIVGICVVETSNPNQDNVQLSMSISGETILFPASKKLYESTQASPDQKFKTLDIKPVSNVVNVSLIAPNTIGASNVVFDVCLEVSKD